MKRPFFILAVCLSFFVAASTAHAVKTKKGVLPKAKPKTMMSLAGLKGKITFRSRFFSTGGIYVVNADGTNQTRLTSDSGMDLSPSFSSDGTKIVGVTSRGNIYNSHISIMEADGTNQTTLQVYGYDPSFSPDGTKIAFCSNPDNIKGIYVMNSDGTDITRLIATETNDGDPCFSPDGKKIAFVSKRDGIREIYLMNSDGTEPMRLTDTGENYSPCFSPDGKKIAFVSTRPSNRGRRNAEIYAMNADGTQQMCLTNSVQIESSPCFSPDGKHIAFTSYRGDGFGTYIMNADGTQQTRIPDGKAREAIHPSWAPGFVPMPNTPVK